MIREIAWRAVARIVTIPAVTNWLIARARLTPYKHIEGPDGSRYMGRWWLFNAYPRDDEPETRPKWMRHLPSVRIHHICRPDSDRHMHDHAWDARTVILRGWYVEERLADNDASQHILLHAQDGTWRELHYRNRRHTGRLLFGEFHRIRHVSDGGTWTLFITWKKRGTWGFLVDGVKVPWRKYLGLEHA